jgi:hypothetical protein
MWTITLEIQTVVKLTDKSILSKGTEEREVNHVNHSVVLERHHAAHIQEHEGVGRTGLREDHRNIRMMSLIISMLTIQNGQAASWIISCKKIQKT